MGQITLGLDQVNYPHNIYLYDSLGNLIYQQLNAAANAGVKIVNVQFLPDGDYNFIVEKVSDPSCKSSKIISLNCGDNLCNFKALKSGTSGGYQNLNFYFKNTSITEKEVYMFFCAFAIKDKFAVYINDQLIRDFGCLSFSHIVKLLLKPNDVLKVNIDGIICDGANQSTTAWDFYTRCTRAEIDQVIQDGINNGFAAYTDAQYHDIGYNTYPNLVEGSLIYFDENNKLKTTAGRINVQVPELDIQYRLFQLNTNQEILLNDWQDSKDFYNLNEGQSYIIEARQKSFSLNVDREVIITPFISINSTTSSCFNGTNLSVNANGADGRYYGSNDGFFSLTYLLYNNNYSYGPQSSGNFINIPPGSYKLRITIRNGMFFFKEIDINTGSCSCLPYGTFISQEQEVNMNCNDLITRFNYYNIYADGYCGTYREFSHTDCTSGTGGGPIQTET